MEKKWKKSVDLSKIGRNKTSSYLIPACNLKIPFTTIKEFGFINAYIDWVDGYDKNNGYLYFLFSPGETHLREWVYFYEMYRKMDTFVKDYYIDFGVIVVCFKIENKYKGLPKLLLKGHYSKFPKEYAKYFVNSQNQTPLRQYDVLIKSEKLRKAMEEVLGYKEGYMIGMELDSIPDKNEEILNYSKLKEKYGI